MKIEDIVVKNIVLGFNKIADMYREVPAGIPLPVVPTSTNKLSISCLYYFSQIVDLSHTQAIVLEQFK
jgi:hypothetical protein